MKLSAALRSNIAAKVAVFALGLTLFYHFDNAALRLQDQSYAPAIVADSVGSISAFAYAVAGALAVWESGRLKRAMIWDLAPVRSRYLIGYNAVLPVLLLSWTMLLLPVTIEFIASSATPTVDSLRPLLQQLALCVAHTIIGFVVGLYAPRLILAPLLAMSVYGFVAFSVATQPYWVRHVSGNYYEPLMFGELASFSALYPPLLFFGSIAAAAIIFWSRIKPSPVRAALALIVALTGTYEARHVVQNRGPSLPIVSHAEPEDCLGQAPRVCAPTALNADLRSARDQAVSVISDLKTIGVDASPELITDRTADGRYQKPSDAKTWRTDIATGLLDGNLKLQLVSSALQFPCASPEPVMRRAVLLWAAQSVHARHAFDEQLAHEVHILYPDQEDRGIRQVSEEIEKVAHVGLALPKENQGEWYQKITRKACEAGT